MTNKISEEVRGHKSGVRAELISHNEPHLWPSRGQDSAPNKHSHVRTATGQQVDEDDDDNDDEAAL